MAGGVVFKDNNGPVSIASDRRIARASILGKLIEIIATSEPAPVDLTREPSETERKMVFNNLNTHLWIIKKYIENALLVDGSITLNRPWFSRHSPSSGNSVSHTLLETAA